jgi:hypothetical protein
LASAKNIKESLLKQLNDKGANVEHFSSLVDDYIWYWSQEKEMQTDIKKRGRSYKAYSAAGNEYDKENSSVKNALMYNKQKLAILKELGISTNNVMSDDEDEL